MFGLDIFSGGLWVCMHKHLEGCSRDQNEMSIRFNGNDELKINVYFLNTKFIKNHFQFTLRCLKIQHNFFLLYASR